jgi:tetratricopeptide (TPR) repeat protein
MKRIVALTVALLLATGTANAEPGLDHYTAGRDAYRAGQYAHALEEFEQSYAATPSPNTHLYIARSLRELGRFSEARESYRATIREAEERGAKYAGAREAAEAELRDLPAEPPAPAATPVAPPPQQPIVEAPVVTPAKSPSALTWTTGSIAVVGLASFGVLYGLASDRYAYLEDHCTRTRTAACDDALSTGRTEEGAAYVALGMGVVAAAITVVSLVVAPTSDGKPKAARPWLVAF